jgi:outer membrane protein TolC
MSSTQDIQNQINLANEYLAECLRDGLDTTEARASITSLEGQLASARAAVQAADRAFAAKQAAELRKNTDTIAADAIAQVDAAAQVAGLTELTGDPVPAVEQYPELQDAAHKISVAAEAVSRAEAARDPLQQEADQHHSTICGQLCASFMRWRRPGSQLSASPLR